MDYSDSKAIIEQTNILSKEDFEFISGNMKELQDNWEKNQRYRTETEMRISVLNDGRYPTPAAKYWQCVREQASFYESLVASSFEYRRLQVQMRRLKRDIEACEDEFDREDLQIDLEQAQFSELQILRMAADRVRELRLWSKLMAEQVEKDPTFDTEDVNTHQLVSYYKRFEFDFATKTNGNPGEIQNIVGQFNTAKRVLEERGQLPKGEEGPRLSYSINLAEVK